MCVRCQVGLLKAKMTSERLLYPTTCDPFFSTAWLFPSVSLARMCVDVGVGVRNPPGGILVRDERGIEPFLWISLLL